MARLSHLSVLIMETEERLALEAGAMLSDLGCIVIGRASTPAEALALIEAFPLEFDAAILDSNLAGEGGELVAEALDAQGIPFLFASRYDAPVVIQPCADKPILQKPFVLIELEQAVRCWRLEQSRKLRRRQAF
jgi:CheY-like chemotaxis protein